MPADFNPVAADFQSSVSAATEFGCEGLLSHGTAALVASSSAPNSPLSGRQSFAGSATNFHPDEIDMSDVYLSDNESEEVAVNWISDSATEPGSEFSCKPSASAAFAPMEPATSHPTSAVGNILAPVAVGTSISPRGFFPPPPFPLQQCPTSAYVSAMPPAGDLAPMESVLQENLPLTQQVMGLIIHQYPVYAANPMALRYAVFNELQLLKKMRQEQATQAVPSSNVPSTSVSGVDGTTGSSVGTNLAVSGSSIPDSSGPTYSSALFAGRSTECGTMAGPKMTEKTTVACSSTFTWTSNAPVTSPTVQKNSYHFGTGKYAPNDSLARLSRNSGDALDSFSSMFISSTSSAVPDSTTQISGSSCVPRSGAKTPVSQSYSASLFSKRNSSGEMKRPAAAEKTAVTFSSGLSVTPRLHRTASGGNGALDCFAEAYNPHRGTSQHSFWETCQF